MLRAKNHAVSFLVVGRNFNARGGLATRPSPLPSYATEGNKRLGPWSQPASARNSPRQTEEDHGTSVQKTRYP